jgi:hypothetical protein
MLRRRTCMMRALVIEGDEPLPPLVARDLRRRAAGLLLPNAMIAGGGAGPSRGGALNRRIWVKIYGGFNFFFKSYGCFNLKTDYYACIYMWR